MMGQEDEQVKIGLDYNICHALVRYSQYGVGYQCIICYYKFESSDLAHGHQCSSLNNDRDIS